MKWIEFLRPNLVKVMLAIAISSLWFCIRFAISFLELPQGTQMILPNNVMYLLIIPLEIAFEALIFYPFSCSLYFLAISYRKGKGFVETLKTKKVLLGLILFNPPVIFLIMNFLAYLFLAYTISQLASYQQCGIVVLSVVPNSPVADAGITPNSVIYRIDGVPLNDNNSTTSVIQSLRPGQTVTLWGYFPSKSLQAYTYLNLTLGNNPDQTVTQGYFGFTMKGNVVKIGSPCPPVL